jgi:ADP-ribose pyrophosphatase
MQPIAHQHPGWTVLVSRIVHDAPPFLRLSVQRLQLPNGRIVENYYQLEKPDFALVVPRFPDGSVLLLRQYKHGTGQAGLYPPGGHLAPGEPPLAAVQRELLEETGHTASHWTALGSYTVDANQGAGRGHLFLAEQLTAVASPDPGDLEDMELIRLSPGQLQTAIRSGEVNALAAIAALTLAETHLITHHPPIG